MSVNEADTETIINDPGRGFLGYLTPSVIRHYRYRGEDQFLIDFKDAFETDTREWFLVTGPEFGPFSFWSSYDAELELLLVRIVKSAAHESAAETFNFLLLEAIGPVGMAHALRLSGGATHITTIGSKEPDKAWKTKHLPRKTGRSQDWPSAVLEVAFSETKAKLQAYVRYWLRASEGDVKIVFTIQIDQNAPKITIEKWESNNNGRKNLEQRITISRTGNNITVSESPLRISFQKLFLRPPSIPKEHHVKIGEEKLQSLAEDVWDVQGF
ncbi:uncharacterized protein BDW70DRAFT_153250 [Aspergillus foveolatus]|uniref:uncharacterized protein n=1 Tax=Aspergillus foveolatus TaxID=210207 RepID=UPI003CCE2BFB